MPDKFSRYCDGIMEAAWLAAVIVVPLFFDIYSSRIFEPDKITLLRSLALVVLAAWIVKLVVEGGPRWDRLRLEPPRPGAFLRTPLVAPVLALAAVYLFATLFSVTPRVSLWGSYQRLQGTYTTFSYIVIFFAMIANLRKRSQVERLVTTIILTSLPAGLYGIMQRYRLDPVPWAGDTFARVAGHMGNSIFLAAYLILAQPFTIVRIYESFSAILIENRRLGAHIARATIYVFIAAVQMIALYLTGSRGPWLGWMAGAFFLFILLFLYLRQRKLMLGAMGAGLVMAVFLVLLNIPDGPLEGLRSTPGVGRLGQLFAAESDTGRVRVLIWEGAVNLVTPHEPLEFPDGRKDAFNFLRPLIGYGPESMYVAYNAFYPPELGQLEKRNASPDRSHNETWDALVITGLSGLLVYLVLFGAIFYYGLNWLGLMVSRLQRWLFFAFYIGGGMAGATVLMIWRGAAFFGVGLPFGVILGLIAYLTLIAVQGSYLPPDALSLSAPYYLSLIAPLAAIMGHFVEITFGIAIASTRTYFWVFAALILLSGYILPKYGEQGRPGAAKESGLAANRGNNVLGGGYKGEAGQKGKKKKPHQAHRRQRPGFGNQAAWMRSAWLWGGLTGIILSTLAFDLVTNNTRSTSVVSILWTAMTRMAGGDGASSYGVLFLVFFTWLAAAVLAVSEIGAVEDGRNWFKALAVVLGVSGGLGILFALLHAGRVAFLATLSPSTEAELIHQVSQVGGLLNMYYLYLFAILLLVGAFLPEERLNEQSSRNKARSRAQAVYAPSIGMVAAPAALILVFVLANLTNLRVIHADIAFKMAGPFTRGDQWGVATLLYKRAIELAPNEDHYYLFLGRSYLEQAKQVEDPQDQEVLVLQAERDLKAAQKINPLNTDHTANLGRLYSWWAGRAPDAEARTARGEISSDYYARALTLSPNNSTLWGEWAILLMEILGKPEEARQRIDHALELDSAYNWTQALMGDFYARAGRAETESAKKMQAFENALAHYRTALEVSRDGDLDAKVNYLVTMGGIYVEMQQHEAAVDVYEQALAAGPRPADLWRIEETLARVYAQLGDKSQAEAHASAALFAAPEDQAERLQALIDSIKAMP